jgi:hypothetical protein
VEPVLDAPVAADDGGEPGRAGLGPVREVTV